MRRFLFLLKHDFLMMYRYGVYYAAIVVSLLWTGILYFLPKYTLQFFFPLALFTDITVIGFMFIGALILFEKSEGSIDAVVVTPIRRKEYIYSKIVSLTLLSLILSIYLGIITLLRGADLNFITMIMNVLLSSVFYILVGIIIVSSKKNVTDFLIGVLIYGFITSIPLIDYMNMVPKPFSYILYIFPTEGLILLMKGISRPISYFNYVYSVVYLLVWCTILYKFSLKSFEKYIVRGEIK